MVFYPLRAVLLLPFSALENRIGWFFVVHLWIAYFGWLFVGNRLLNRSANSNEGSIPGQSSLAVAITGATYALSGPVFFQIYNPPFLIGACWLPLVMGELMYELEWRDNPQSSRMPSSLFLVSVSMTFLAGDIQSVYHVFLLASLMLLIQAFREGWRFSSSIRRGSLKMSLAVVFIVGITAVQWLPTYYWYRISERSIPSKISTDYAVAWWEFVSVFQPNIFGSLIPSHTRWAQVFDPQKRVWVPSIHLSVFVVCGAFLAVASRAFARTRSRSELDRNLQTTTIINPLIFLFTVVTLLIASLSSLEGSPLDQLWRLTLPIYESFRYSAKWTTFIAWGGCFLAMIGWHEWNPNAASLLIVRRVFLSCLALSIVCLAFHCVATNSQSVSDILRVALHPILDDPLCGPFDYSRSMKLLGWSSLVNILFALSSIMVLRLAKSGRLVTLLGTIAFIQISLAAYDQVVAVNPKVFVSYAGDLDADRIIQENWIWGDRSQKVLLPRVDSSRDENVASANASMQISASEMLVHRQVASRVGKLHLLFGERSFLADFTLRPRAINLAFMQDSKYFWQARPATIENDPSKVIFNGVTIEPTVVGFQYECNGHEELSLPILQDGGWSCDTKDVVILPDSLGSRIRLAVNRGNDNVLLRYFTPGLGIGLGISLFTIVAFCISLVWKATATVHLFRLRPH